MNSLHPLNQFLKKSHTDPKIRVAHFAVYLSLYEVWLHQKGKNPIEVDTKLLMLNAKISSSATWHQVIRALDEYGYIQYIPSFNRFKRSRVYL